MMIYDQSAYVTSTNLIDGHVPVEDNSDRKIPESEHLDNSMDYPNEIDPESRRSLRDSIKQIFR